MKRDPDFAWFAVCVLGSLLAYFALALLTGCASPRAPEPLPKVLPHYPCERIEHGRTVYHACSADEWMYQQILKGKQ